MSRRGAVLGCRDGFEVAAREALQTPVVAVDLNDLPRPRRLVQPVHILRDHELEQPGGLERGGE
jgi:hypothetical protein